MKGHTLSPLKQVIVRAIAIAVTVVGGSLVPVAAQCQTQKLWGLPVTGGQSGGAFGTTVATDGDLAVISAVSGSGGLGSGHLWFLSRTTSTWTMSNDFYADSIGHSLLIAPGMIIVGAPGDSSAGALPFQGSASVFTPWGTSWVYSNRLLAQDGTSLDSFGWALANDGQRLVLGAPKDNNGSSGSSGEVGSVYVFESSPTGWTQVNKLLASDGADSDRFGEAVGISGDEILVGAPLDDDVMVNSGSVYVFRKIGPAWVEQGKLHPSDPTTGAVFGRNLQIVGSSAFIGSMTADLGTASGSVYVFERTTSGWVQQQKLLASDGAVQDHFGESFSFAADVAVIGAPGDDDAGDGSGSAYVFRRAGGQWSQAGKFVASDAGPFEAFGSSVALSGNRALISAPGGQHPGSMQGSVYAFDVDGPDCDGNGLLDGCELLAGAVPDCNSNQVPDGCDLVLGTSQDLNGTGVPDECELAGTSFCSGDGSGTPCPCANESGLGDGRGCLNSFGTGARLMALGTASVSGDTVTLFGTGMPPLASALYFQGTGQDGSGQGTQLGDGLRCAGGAVIRLGVKSNVGGGVVVRGHQRWRSTPFGPWPGSGGWRHSLLPDLVPQRAAVLHARDLQLQQRHCDPVGPVGSGPADSRRSLISIDGASLYAAVLGAPTMSLGGPHERAHFRRTVSAGIRERRGRTRGPRVDPAWLSGPAQCAQLIVAAGQSQWRELAPAT